MSRIKRRVLSACGVLLAAAALGSAAAPAASAATVCYSGYVCVYNDHFTGAMQSYGAVYAGRLISFDHIKMAVWNNYTSRSVRVSNPYGWWCVPPGGRYEWGTWAIYVDSGRLC